MGLEVTRRAFLGASAGLALRAQTNHSKLVFPGSDGRLVYEPDALGNRIPDFSSCGYMGGGVPIPDADVRIEVETLGGDATARIQDALDTVARLDLDDRGLRGAVLLKRGRHSVGGTLHIGGSGVVLRGEDGTVLAGTGRRQRDLIDIRGASAGRTIGSAIRVTAEYVPVGATVIPVASSATFKPGDTVIVRRLSNAAWITEIGMDRIPQRPDDPNSTVQWTPFNLDFERRVLAVEENAIRIDAPIVCAIEQRWGGGAVYLYDDSARLFNVGVENLRGESEFDPAVRRTLSGESYFADEQHAWTLINIEFANHVWVRNVTARYFGFALADIGRARWVTVQDCDNGEMVSEITGSRRYSYHFATSQLSLVQRCVSDTGRHDFVVGARVPGPNAFVDCEAKRMFADSEPHHRWSVGGLYDNVKASIRVQDRSWYGTGHGWSGANYVVWNCEGELVLQRPPTAQNWAIGHVGRKVRGAFEPREDGHWESFGQRVAPASLYRAQLAERTSG